jgi:hypothetical protein
MIASIVPPPKINPLDVNGQCYIVQSPILDNAVIDNFYQSKLPSFKVFESSDHSSLSTKDFKELLVSPSTYVNDLVEITNRSPEFIMTDMANYFETKKLFLPPTGISGLVHRATNGLWIAGSAIQSAVATMKAYGS